MAQNEEPLTQMACTCFRRRYDTCCNPVAQALKVSGDIVEAKGQMAGDIFEEDPLGSCFADDPGDVWPEVARIVRAQPVAGEREGLAGITGSDEMNAVAPRSAVEGSQIVPHRSRSQGRVRHPRHESGRGVSVPLDVTHSSIAGLCEVNAEVQSSDAGANAEAAKFFMS